jgi:spermidine/putrescine transport system permease protein
MSIGRWLAAMLMAPLALLMVGFVVLPGVVLAGVSLFRWVYSSPEGPATLSNFRDLIGSVTTWRVILNTVQIALPVTGLSLAGGYLLAYRIVLGPPREGRVLFVLILTALMASFLVRVYAWRTLLGTSGVINGALMASGLVDAPVDLLLFSKTAVVIAELSLFMPLAALTLFAALSGIDPSLREASRDLGAGPTQTLFRVIVPITGPALLATTALIFYLSCGDYLTPVFVGGPNAMTVGRLIAESFGMSANYGRGAALSVLVAVGFVMMFVLLRTGMRATRLLPARVM